MKYSILMLNFNGANLLESTIPHTLEQMKKNQYQGDLVIVDNNSSDNSREVFDRFSSNRLKWISCSENKVLFSYNEIVNNSTAEIIILLNNDEWIDSRFITVIMDEFNQSSNDKLFCLIPRSLDEQNGDYQGGLIGLEFKSGHYWVAHNYERDRRNQKQTVVVGCLGAYSKSKFIELGGFEPLLYPFYWEDVDLSYRASKRGWLCKYIPDAITYHSNQATIGRFDKSWINLINRRNKLLFFYLNCNDKKHWRKHFFTFPAFLIQHVLMGDLSYLKAWFWCIINWAKILRRRSKRMVDKCLPDSALI